MSHDKIGPHEQRLRELREERQRKTNRKVGVTKAPRPLIPFAGKDKLVRGGKNSPNTRRTKGDLE